MMDWSNEVRELGNKSAHPNPGETPSSAQDAGALVRFLDFFLECIYSLPHRIEEFRQRSETEETEGAKE